MVLSLDYSILQKAATNLNKLSDELDQYCDDLSKKVQKEFYSVKGGSSAALNNADYYVGQKIKKLGEKKTNAQKISSEIFDFVETAKRVDDEVKKTIEDNQKTLFQNYPSLRPSDFQLAFTAFICDLEDVPILGNIVQWKENVYSAVDELFDNIKFWYRCEGGKELVDIVVAAALTVLSVVALVCACVFTGGTVIAVIVGVAGIISSVIALANAATNLITSINSYNCALRNEHGRSKIFSGQDRLSDWLTQTNFKDKFWNNFSNNAAFAVEVTDTICSVIAIADLTSKISKSLNAKNLKQTFRAICQPRDANGRFAKGKPSILNGLKTLKSRFNLKEFVLGDLNLSKVREITKSNKFVDILKDKDLCVKYAKALKTFIGAEKTLVTDLDNIRNGKLNLGEFVAKRVVTGFDSTVFKDRNDRKNSKLFSDTTALKKLGDVVVNKVGLGKFICEKAGVDSIYKSTNMKSGLADNLKRVRNTFVNLDVLSIGTYSAGSASASAVDIKALTQNKTYFNVPKIAQWNGISINNTGVAGASNIDIRSSVVRNLPNIGAAKFGAANAAVQTAAQIKTNTLPTLAEFVKQTNIPTQTIPKSSIPSVDISLNINNSVLLPNFEFRARFNSSYSYIDEQVPFTFLKPGRVITQP